MGATPESLLDSFKPYILLQTPDDYRLHQIHVDASSPAENQYAKFKFYLGTHHRESAWCCPKHAPLEKISRTSKPMWSFFLVNMGIVMVQISFFAITFLLFKYHY